MIGRRHVFHIGGYDPIDPERQFERFRLSLSSFERTWNVSSQTSAIAETSKVSACWDVEAWGPNWKTRMTFEMLRWDDLILRDSQRGMWSRLGQSWYSLFDFVVTGAWFRYVYANWRYAVFFIFPYLYVVLFGLAGAAIAYAVTRLSGLTGVYAAISGIFIAAAIFLGLMHWLGPRRRINHVLDDAIFSRQFLYGQRPEMEQRIDDFASKIIERARKADVDEILVVGHSLGAALTMAAVARALKQDPQLANHGPTLCVLTVGATIPKFSLHPKGDRIRQATQIVADELSIQWTEYQARDDAISFYRFDPVTLKRVSRDHPDGRPNIRRVQIHSMMDPASFRRHRFHYMRMHYQFLMGNGRRAPYDYCMIICGPLDFDDITAPLGGVDRFQADGSVIDGLTALKSTAAQLEPRTGASSGV
jgi:pimeloyl-ACP methyl ester carboxylesterase